MTRHHGFVPHNGLTVMQLRAAEKDLAAGLARAAKLDDVKLDADGYSRRQREEMLVGMHFTVRVFYALAVAAHVHAFREFTGLMNNYVEACADAEKRGAPWVEANECSGSPLRWHTGQLKYIDEKLRCMFGFGLDFQSVGGSR